jgi:hypothetical protein
MNDAVSQNVQTDRQIDPTPVTSHSGQDGAPGDLRPIEGGNITSPSDRGEEPIQFGPEAKHRADTARFLAYALVGVLGLSFVMHYSAMHVAAFYGQERVAEKMSTLFGAWLPVISSLVSAAVTYYFTRESGLNKSR